MTTLYRINGDYLFEEENGWYHTYGVTAVLEDGTVREIRDISTDRERVSDFIGRCNEGALDPIHLEEAVEDLIG